MSELPPPGTTLGPVPDQLPIWTEEFFEQRKRISFRLPPSTVKLLYERVPDKNLRSKFANECLLHFLKHR